MVAFALLMLLRRRFDERKATQFQKETENFKI